MNVLELLLDILSIVIVVGKILRVYIASFVLLIAIPFLIFVITRILRDRFIRILCKNRTAESINFSDAEVVLPAKPLRGTVFSGAVLFVPNGTKAVTARPPTGNPESFPEGEHVIRFQASSIPIQYVDMRRRTTTYMVEKASSKDGFNISLRVKISWQVKNEIEVAAIKDPITEIFLEIEKAVRSTMVDYNHDQLVTTSGCLPVNDNELVEKITQELITRELFKGIKLLTLVLDARIGDPQKTLLTQETSRQEISAKLAEAKLDKRLKLGDKEKKVMRLDGEIQQEKILIEKEIRQEKARTKVEEEKILFSIREQELMLEQRREQHRLEYEREKLHLQARTAVLAPVIQTYSNLLAEPIGRSSNNDRDVNRLGEAVHSIIQGIGNYDPNVLQGDFIDVTDFPKDAKTSLYNQIRDAASVEGFTSHSLQETSNGRWLLKMWVGGCNFNIWYNLGGRSPAIVSIIVVNSIDSFFKIEDLDSYHRLKLQQVIRKLLEKYGPC